MRLSVKKDIHALHTLIKEYYDSYNVIHDTQLNENTYFLVIEKFFFRNSSRASLSIVLVRDDYSTIIDIVGSGGGQGMIFKFDWGAKESFEKGVLKIFSENTIDYNVLSE